MTKKQTEKEIENTILDYLTTYVRGYFWKNNSVGVYDSIKKVYRKPSRYHINGVSDIIGVLPCGTACFIEVKTATGRLSKNQKDFLERMKENNAIAFVARNVDDVRTRLQGQARD